MGILTVSGMVDAQPDIINAMKMLVKVIAVLQDGPATSQDIADELGISVKEASAYLSDLEGAGIVHTSRILRTERNKKILVRELTVSAPSAPQKQPPHSQRV